VILVSNIRRAVNDKSTKELLSLALRTQLCKHGFTGQLIHVATQTDQIVRSEMLENLSLPEDTDVLGCALARNAFTRNKLTRDFFHGIALEDLPVNQHNVSLLASSSSSSQDAGKLRFEYPVFTVSSIDFQKGLGTRPEDGGPIVFNDILLTDVPALRGLLSKISSDFRSWTVSRKVGDLLLEHAPITSAQPQAQSQAEADTAAPPSTSDTPTKPKITGKRKAVPNEMASKRAKVTKAAAKSPVSSAVTSSVPSTAVPSAVSPTPTPTSPTRALGVIVID